MARRKNPTRIEELSDAVRVESHGKGYALAPENPGFVVYAVADDGSLTLAGSGIDRTAAMKVVEESASGRNQARAMAHFKWIEDQAENAPADVRHLVDEAGFEIAHTGGGCLAWRKDLDNGEYLLVCTEDNTIDADPAAKEWLVGRHSDDGGMVEIDGATTLEDALRIAELLPAATDANGMPVEIRADDADGANAQAKGIADEIEATKARMGYDGMLRAKGLVVDGLTYEVGLVAPNGIYKGYAVIVHNDCDPDNPTQGSSGVEEFDDLEDAKDRWCEAIGEPSHSSSPAM